MQYCFVSSLFVVTHIAQGLTLVIQIGSNSDLNIKHAIAIFEMFHLKQFKSRGTIVRALASLGGLLWSPTVDSFCHSAASLLTCVIVIVIATVSAIVVATVIVVVVVIVIAFVAVIDIVVVIREPLTGSVTLPLSCSLFFLPFAFVPNKRFSNSYIGKRCFSKRPKVAQLSCS